MKNIYNFSIREVKDQYVMIPNDEQTFLFCKTKYQNEKEATLTEYKNRILKHHRKLFAVIDVFLENLDIELTVEECLTYLKIKTGRYKKIKMNGADVIIPNSISFAEMEQTEFEKFYNEALGIMAGALGVKKSELENEGRYEKN